MDLGTFYPPKELIFEVEFERVLDLVAKRSVVLREGRAYIAQSNLATLVINQFQQRLSRSLEVCAKALPRMDEDERLLPILQNMSSQYGSQEYQSSGAAGTITADSVNSVSLLLITSWLPSRLFLIDVNPLYLFNSCSWRHISHYA